MGRYAHYSTLDSNEIAYNSWEQKVTESANVTFRPGTGIKNSRLTGRRAVPGMAEAAFVDAAPGPNEHRPVL